MAVLLLGVLVISAAFISGMGTALERELAPLIESLEGNQAVSMVVLELSIASFAVIVGLLLIVFLAVGKFIAKPVKRITRAMGEFLNTNEPPVMTHTWWAPKEVLALEQSFIEFTDQVAQVHKHDQEISRVKSDFISTAAHQLRTPLTGIRWALEALEREELTDSQKALVASATEKSHQLVAVVGTLLDISSIESGKYKYSMAQAALTPLVRSVVTDFAPLAEQAKVSLTLEERAAEATVIMDAERIRWVLNNLIENGIRYTPQGGSVRVVLDQAPGFALVRIRDTGIGIAPEDRGNIFTRFYRAPAAIAKQNGGNGLGLYIARTIANDHRGELDFKANETGPGTEFILSLPLAGTQGVV